jgi:peptidoglycan/LPS O-acetylase OafA/YrhL
MLTAAGIFSFGLAVALTLPFAVASWFLVERPALRLKPRRTMSSADPLAHQAPRAA